MDPRNGELFDHHAELFAQIGSVADHDSFKEFMLESGNLVDPSGTSKNVSLPTSDGGSTSHENVWNHSYNCNESAGLLMSHNRNMYNTQVPSQMDLPPIGDADNTSALIETLVKNISNPDAVLDQYNSQQHFSDKKPALVGHGNHVPGSLFDGLHRISTDKVTQDILDNLNRLETSDSLNKCNEFSNLTWNGAINEPGNLQFQSRNRSVLNMQSSIDKNGNSAVFDNTHGEKIPVNFVSYPSEHFVTRTSPSASLESNVRTPTTSYESASPLSSNRTPIRSDESISPMGSGHTPLRMDDSASPSANAKTPMRTDEGSPVGRTPLRTEEGFSPAGPGSSNPLPSRTDASPSHKLNGQTPQRFENYSSPPGFPKKAPDVKSPASTVLPSPSPSKPERVEESGKTKEGTEETSSKSKDPERPRAKDDPVPVPVTGESGGKSSSSKGDDSSASEKFGSAIPTLEALIKRQTNKKLPIPFVSAKRIDDDPILCRKAAKRTFPRKSDSELYVGSSSLPGKCESEPESSVIKQVGVKTENKVPDVEKDKTKRSKEEEAVDLYDDVDDAFAKSKKRRRKTGGLCLPNAKRRCRKKVTIYQSSVSAEEAGIKLKIKLAPPTAKPQKKRRSRKLYASDEEDGSPSNKRTKKSVRFSSATKESENIEQAEWASKIPATVLHKIFKYVVEEQGCVPSLVRLSSVCKLWNSVASRSDLWQNIDLSSPYIKQKCRIDRYFRWLLENRLENILQLNLNGWKFSNITMILSLIGTHCTEIESIGLAGWQGLHYEHLKSLLQDCPKLAKLDLSDVSPESKSANSAVSQKSITFLTQTMGERLTQLILAHNTLTCLPQIISSLATHCPNLQVLDLSNVRRVSHTEFALNIEHLQEGCQKLRVLRVTNSSITLANVPLEKQVASPGFPNLEELSIAGHQDVRITSVIDDNSLERILKSSHKLKLLDVRGCTRITDSSLVRVPAWDIKHLFLSGCYVTRQCGSGLELIAQKWSHSLVEIDLAWTTVTEDLNAAVMAFAEKGPESPLRIMNLCGSSVTLEPVKAILTKCINLEWLNLQSCRGLPRGVKRLYEKEQLTELRNMLDKKDSESESENKQSPACSTNTNTKDDDLLT